MIIIKGKTACEGIAFGTVFVFSREENTVKRIHVDSSEAEIERFEKAREQAVAELGALYERAVREVGEANAAIFRIHRIMLDDMDYIESVKNIIADQMINSETAVAQTCDNFVAMFDAMEDAYIRERSADVKDVSERIIKILSGKEGGSILPENPMIIFAENLVPSETVQFNKSTVLAYVTEGGSSNSHTSILARTMNIPAVIGAKDIYSKQYDGKQAIVDGFDGTIYIDPDEETVREMTEKQSEVQKRHEMLCRLKHMPSVTKDGQSVKICANIDSAADIASVLENDAEGIGLVRSEFLYLDNRDYMTEDFKCSTYREILTAMGDKRVVVRTVDVGADKQANHFDLQEEKNPSMGIRGIRYCLKNPEIFKSQLRALYRASVYGNLAIMFPMITAEWEIIEVLEIIDEVKKELKNDGIAYSDAVELGCMIETPAAALASDILAKHLDFFSIGTNDLAQYMLAADRNNPQVSKFYDTHHISVLRAIKIATDNAHKHGKWIGICGELGADTDLTETLLAIGVDEISVSPALVLPVRGKVIETDVSLIKEKIIKKLG